MEATGIEIQIESEQKEEKPQHIFSAIQCDLNRTAYLIRQGKNVIRKWSGMKEDYLDVVELVRQNQYYVRHLHIAYCELKGRHFSSIENSCKPCNEPDWDFIEKLKIKYLKKMVKFALLRDSEKPEKYAKLFSSIPKKKKKSLTKAQIISKARDELKRAQVTLDNLFNQKPPEVVVK